MIFFELVAALARLGVSVSYDEDKFRYRAPSGGLTPEAKASILQYKAHLVGLLKALGVSSGQWVHWVFEKNNRHGLKGTGEPVYTWPELSGQSGYAAPTAYTLADRMQLIKWSHARISLWHFSSGDLDLLSGFAWESWRQADEEFERALRFSNDPGFRDVLWKWEKTRMNLFQNLKRGSNRHSDAPMVCELNPESKV